MNMHTETHPHPNKTLTPPLPLNTLNVQMCKCCQAIGPNVVHTVIVNMGSFGIPGTRYCGTTPNEHSVTGIAQFPVSIANYVVHIGCVPCGGVVSCRGSVCVPGTLYKV